MISPLLTNLKSSSSEKTLLYISDITRVEMKLGKTRIEYMLRIRSISQRKWGVLMEKQSHYLPLQV